MRALALCVAGASVIGSLFLSGTVAQASGLDIVATVNVTFSSQVVNSGEFVFVASDAEISVINVESNAIVRTVSTVAALNPQGSAIVGHKVYFANSASDNITILNTNTWTVSYLTTTGCVRPSQLLPMDSMRLVVNCVDSSSIQVIDTAADVVLQTVAVGTSPAAMSANGSKVFVPNSRSSPDSVSIVDTSVNPASVTTVVVGTQPEGTTYFDGQLFVVNFEGPSVSILMSSYPYTLNATPSVSPRPQAIAACAGKIFTANRDSGNSSVIDPTSNLVTQTIALGGTGATTHVLGVNGGHAYFLNYSLSTVSVVDCAAEVVVGAVNSASGPSSISFTCSNAYIGGLNQISVLTLPENSCSETTPVNARQRPAYLQQLPRAPGTDCNALTRPDLDWYGNQEVWEPSWAEWAVPISGGPVCTRLLE